MTAHEFVENYIMHDSLVDSVEVHDYGATIVLLLDFAFWMQPGYNETDPETGTLKIIFNNVSEFSISENVDWNTVSILDTADSEGMVKFSLMNDLTDEYLELIIRSNHIIVEKN